MTRSRRRHATQRQRTQDAYDTCFGEAVAAAADARIGMVRARTP